MSVISRFSGDTKTLLGRKTYWSTYATRLAVVGVSFLIGVLSARSLGPAGRGTYAVALVSAGLLVQIANFGFSSAILYLVSKGPARSSRLLSFAWLMGGALLGLGLLLLFSLPVVAQYEGYLVVLWASVQLALLLQDQIFLGARQFNRYNFLQLAGRCVALVAACAAVLFFPGRPASFIAFLIAADGALLVTGTLLLGRRAGWRLPPRRLMRVLARLAVRAFPVLLLPFLLIRSDILLVRLFRGPAETGVYSIAAQLIDFVLLLPGMFSAVLFVSLPGSQTRARDTIAVAGWVLRLLGLLAIPLVLLGWFAIPVIFGVEFAPAYWPMLLLLPGALALGLETVVAQYFAREGYPGFVSRYLLTALLLNVAINLLAIPAFGLVGAAFARTVSYTLVTILIVRRFLRETGLSLKALWRSPGPARLAAGATAE